METNINKICRPGHGCITTVFRYVLIRHTFHLHQKNFAPEIWILHWALRFRFQLILYFIDHYI